MVANPSTPDLRSPGESGTNTAANSPTWRKQQGVVQCVCAAAIGLMVGRSTELYGYPLDTVQCFCPTESYNEPEDTGKERATGAYAVHRSTSERMVAVWSFRFRSGYRKGFGPWRFNIPCAPIADKIRSAMDVAVLLHDNRFYHVHNRSKRSIRDFTRFASFPPTI